MLVLGAAAVFSSVTGMSVYAASMLIPLSTVGYTLAGGLKATFLSSCAPSPRPN